MENVQSKYSKEMVKEAVKRSQSIMGVMRCLGMKTSTGSMHGHTKNLIKVYGIDISHFTGRAHNKGAKDPKRLSADQILVLDRLNGLKESSDRIRRALDEIGVRRICSKCGGGEVWMDNPLRLQIEHKNGNPLDNRRKNLVYLCPNCHSQTETFGKNKGDQERQKVDKFCLDCGVLLGRLNKSGYCCRHHNKHKRRRTRIGNRDLVEGQVE